MEEVMDKKNEIVKSEGKNIEKARGLQEVAPAVDIFESENEIMLYADMPGVVKENLSVNIDKGILSLSGVRKLQTKKTATWEEFGNVNYVRSFSVPPTIDVGRVEAELKDGVLRLHMTKSEQAKPKKIEIKTA